MKLKPLTNKQKEQEIESLKKLVEKYKKEASKPGRRKREIIPFELEIGNFCCEKLHKEITKKTSTTDIIIKHIVGSYYQPFIQMGNPANNYKTKVFANYCPYCDKHINEFFYIKEY